jgi:hypothetical protein
MHVEQDDLGPSLDERDRVATVPASPTISSESPPRTPPKTVIVVATRRFIRPPRQPQLHSVPSSAL